MYFPYLYGRRHELLAIRAILTDPRHPAPFLPIIEPVNTDTSSLEKCITECQARGQNVCLIINPGQGGFDGNHQAFAARLANFSNLVSSNSVVIPTILLNPGVSVSDVSLFLSGFPGRGLGIAYGSNAFSPANIQSFIAAANVVLHINTNGWLSPAAVSSVPVTKYVDVRDEFKAKATNAHYVGQEFFTQRHLAGSHFGDYASIGSVFREGGGIPAQVAIHEIYKRPSDKHIWIEHFVSNLAVGTVQAKFLDAAGKLLGAVNARPSEFGTNQGLQAYSADYSSSHFPGLGKNKEYQLIHHMCLIIDFLNGVI